MITITAIGDLIRETRGNRSLREMERISGVSHTYLSSIEKGIDPRSGNTIIPTPEVLKKLEGPLGIKYEDLMKTAGYLERGSDHFLNMLVSGEIEGPEENREQLEIIRKFKNKIEERLEFIEQTLPCTTDLNEIKALKIEREEIISQLDLLSNYSKYKKTGNDATSYYFEKHEEDERHKVEVDEINNALRTAYGNWLSSLLKITVTNNDFKDYLKSDLNRLLEKYKHHFPHGFKLTPTLLKNYIATETTFEQWFSDFFDAFNDIAAKHVLKPMLGSKVESKQVTELSVFLQLSNITYNYKPLTPEDREFITGMLDRMFPDRQ